MQKAKFFMEYLRVTQGINVGSHLGSLALDFGGKDTGVDKLYCPCDMRVVRTRFNANGELYLESLEEVLFADGTSDYLRMLLIHDSSFNVTEGEVLTQGRYFYDEGGMGSGNPQKFANHVHIEAGKGKWQSASQFQNSEGVYVIENQSRLEDLFILGDDVIIIPNDTYPAYNYKWKRVSDLEPAPLPTEDVIYGVDLSKHQELTAAEEIIANGKADFVILRVSVGSSSVDENLQTYLNAVKGKKHLGFYSANYFYSEQDAVAEADYLIDTIESYGVKPSDVTLPIFSDWEGFSYSWNLSQGRDVTPQQIQDFTKIYCDRIIERGYKAGVYLNKDYWDNKYGIDYFEKNPRFFIWYARPGLEIPDRDCYLWQYAVENGSDFGYNSNIDKNILFGNYINNEINPQPTEDYEKLLEQYRQLEAVATNLAQENETLKSENQLFKDTMKIQDDKIANLTKKLNDIDLILKS